VSASELCWPLPLIRQRADPHLSVHGGRYWFTATVPAYDAIELRCAASVAELPDAEPQVIWRRHERGPMSWHIWAPELHRIDGVWVIYFAASERDDIWKLRMHVLSCEDDDPLRGRWQERGPIVTPIDSFALDATSFVHRGQSYLAWAQKDPAIEGNTNLYLARLSNPWTLSGKPVRLSQPEHDWECQGFWVNEGPAVIVRGDKVVMSYSASATDHRYCMGLLWADAQADLLNASSWHKSPQPVFVSGQGQWGPGHNSFTTTLDGRQDLLVYHARPRRELQGDPLSDPDRHTRVQALNWGSDGLPQFGVPAPDGLYRLCPLRCEGAAKTPHHDEDAHDDVPGGNPHEPHVRPAQQSP
jgi:GH43 family beta-xylosidase